MPTQQKPHHNTQTPNYPTPEEEIKSKEEK